MTTYLNFIDGEFVKGSGPGFANHYPVTGEVIGEISAAGRAEVDAAVGAARAALKGPWGRMPVAERVALLRKLAEGINARFDEFLAAEIRDTGKPAALASHIDIPRGAANFNVFADQVLVTGTECFEMDTPDGRGAVNYSIRRPRGVIGVI
ncbi:MAG TPA: aldehyde dehydrogenase family protein, partial [Paracoccus sp. (in: a-proteobacteria)]|nr:aldehyde dehydrogenase family protein [Paracoccus sp. (in: a-proteobacteria)]